MANLILLWQCKLEYYWRIFKVYRNILEMGISFVCLTHMRANTFHTFELRSWLLLQPHVISYYSFPSFIINLSCCLLVVILFYFSGSLYLLLFSQEPSSLSYLESLVHFIQVFYSTVTFSKRSSLNALYETASLLLFIPIL